MAMADSCIWQLPIKNTALRGGLWVRMPFRFKRS